MNASSQSVAARQPTAQANSRDASRRWLAFLGPAVLVSVGYMDPGNWATDLEGGARFGYDLLWVLLASNAMALLLQCMSAKLGIVGNIDLASACRREYPVAIAWALWILAEVAIVACDLAELLGSAVALNLLFDLPLAAGALLTSLDVLLILGLQQRGMRRLEAIVLALLVTVALCMLLELTMAGPSHHAALRGLVPRLNGESLYVAIGILGATVMPHNLYLHSALGPKAVAPSQRTTALRRSHISTALALNIALCVNAAILVLAAAAFSTRGLAVVDLKAAHHLLAPLLGSAIAPVAFAVALLCSGQSATISGTLAGQIIMEGFVQIRMRPGVRRLLTRGLAIIPALAVLLSMGESGVMPLLIASQVVLSLQLPFAIVPLIKMTGSDTIMQGHANSRLVQLLAAGCAALIVGANVALIIRMVAELRASAPLWGTLLIVIAAAALGLLCVLCCLPLQHAAKPVPGRSTGRSATALG